MEVLQTSALPLGDGADRERILGPREHRIVPDASQPIKDAGRRSLSRALALWYDDGFYR